MHSVLDIDVKVLLFPAYKFFQETKETWINNEFIEIDGFTDFNLNIVIQGNFDNKNKELFNKPFITLKQDHLSYSEILNPVELNTLTLNKPVTFDLNTFSKTFFAQNINANNNFNLRQSLFIGKKKSSWKT